MSYKKQDFVDGQVLEAEHLNHIEEGLKALEENGGSVTIVDCATLPTENVNENAFYRLVSGKFVLNQMEVATYVCQCVDVLPEVGELVMDESQMRMFFYYNNADGLLYGYFNDTLATNIGVPGTGWYDVTMLFGDEWGGVITSMDDDPDDGKLRLLLSYKIYHHKGGSWTSLDPMSVGWTGSGNGAEIFNFQGNTASGHYSHAEGGQTIASANFAHAEGYQTEATAEASHAEGRDTEAVGEHSHAEGFLTDATGENSHAEGNQTVASGENAHSEGSATLAEGVNSHAEGDGTQAIGVVSHAEGYGGIAWGDGSHVEGYQTNAYGNGSHVEGFRTVARGAYQHVYGVYNIEDEVVEGDSYGRGKYVTIVGNGEPNNSRECSNAYTLDWDGNAWYAGSIEGKKLVLRSPNGTKYDVTVDNNGNLNRVSGGSGSSGACAWDDVTGKPFDSNGCINEECIPDTIARLSDIGSGDGSGGGVSSWNDLTDKPLDENGCILEELIPDTIARVSDIPAGGGSGDGFSGSWNDLTDKPFGEVTYVVLDSDTEYLEVVEYQEGTNFLKFSNDAPEKDFFIGKTLMLTQLVDGVETDVEGVVEPQYIAEGDGFYSIEGFIIVVTADSATLEGVTLTRGCWFYPPMEELVRISIPSGESQLDDRLIPDTIARTADFVTEEWSFTLTDGSVVTKKVVTAV